MTKVLNILMVLSTIMAVGVTMVLASPKEELETYERVTPPQKYIGFCIRDPKPCSGGTDHPEVSSRPFAELDEVNRWVNSFPKVSEGYQNDEWRVATEKSGGDCEDLALAKQMLLREKGWPESSLLIATAKRWNGEGHAVLIVSTKNGAFVLDNLNNEVKPWSSKLYEWNKIQSPLRPYIWNSLQPTILPPPGTEPPFVTATRK